MASMACLDCKDFSNSLPYMSCCAWDKRYYTATWQPAGPWVKIQNTRTLPFCTLLTAVLLILSSLAAQIIFGGFLAWYLLVSPAIFQD
jgi:hypothetical protein